MMEEEVQLETTEQLEYPVLPTISNKTEPKLISGQSRLFLGFESLLHNHCHKSKSNLAITLDNYYEISQDPLVSRENLVLNQPFVMTKELGALKNND
jgi:hypothetical protein